MAKDKASIIDKVEKLLRLADEDSGGTEAERENAREQAQKLIFKYRVEMYELDHRADKGGMTDADVIVAEFSKSGMVEGSFYAYIILGMGGMAVKTNLDKGRGVYTYIFPPNSKDTIMALADRLWLWCKMEMAVAKIEARPSNPNSFRRAFMRSASSVLHDRIKALEEELNTDSSLHGMDLILHDSNAVERKTRELFPRLGRARHSQLKDSSGHAAGRAAGERANISKGSVSSGGSRRLKA